MKWPRWKTKCREEKHLKRVFSLHFWNSLHRSHRDAQAAKKKNQVFQNGLWLIRKCTCSPDLNNAFILFHPCGFRWLFCCRWKWGRQNIIVPFFSHDCMCSEMSDSKCSIILWRRNSRRVCCPLVHWWKLHWYCSALHFQRRSYTVK